MIKTQDLTMYIPQNLPLNVYVFSQDGHPTKPQFIQQVLTKIVGRRGKKAQADHNNNIEILFDNFV